RDSNPKPPQYRKRLSPGHRFRYPANNRRPACARSAPSAGRPFPGERGMSLQVADPETARAPWTRKHLLGLEDLTRADIQTILDAAGDFVEVSQHHDRKRTDLKGKVVVNLFFEPSTRTRTSFGLAARRLSADTVDFTSGGSSVSKGETFIDTAKNIEALGIDAVVVRHSVPGAPHLLSQHLGASIINAGDGAHEHPTQGLLDIFTIRQ